MTESQLRSAIADLLLIQENGQLSQLVTDWANECREMGLPEDSQLYQPSADFKAKEVVRTLNTMAGTPLPDGTQEAREQLLIRPRQAHGLELIHEFASLLRAAEAQEAADAKLNRERRRVG